MKNINIFLCSPHQNGVTDQLAKIFCKNLKHSNLAINIYALRDYKYKCCTGCGLCSIFPHKCVLDKNGDEAEFLFNAMLVSSLIVFACPVYFYSVPAQFKALIDRSQRFWAEKKIYIVQKPAIPIFAAARTNGRQLFRSSLITLSLFLQNLGFKITDPQTFRGLEKVIDISESVNNDLFLLGGKWKNEMLKS